MRRNFNLFLDKMSEYFAHRKGLLPMLGILLVFINGVLQFLPVSHILVGSNLLLHLGVIIAILGFILAWAL